MRKNIIVTGGAGYIGSHVCKQLAFEGFNPITVDNLSRGYENFVKWGPLYQTDLRDFESLLKIFKEENPIGVVHLASYAYVGESVNKPLHYYDNNVIGGINLFKVMKECHIKNLVFSSSCAVYGTPNETPITENEKLAPINPYGQSKLILENIIRDLIENASINAVILRYFNASGADNEMEIGECHKPETHLIPLAIRACMDESYYLSVFGNDYPTPDGTCIRDYIHVSDLALAHVKSIKKMLIKPTFSATINLGSGIESSVMDIIKTIEEETGNSVKYKIKDRRLGDPPTLVSSILKAKKELNWAPQFSNLSIIISSALKWYNFHN
jgi:UDP-arabinose 4-epimerase